MSKIKEVGGYFAVSNEDRQKTSLRIAEEFKGESNDEQVFFPRGLGAKHPFEFETVEKLISRDGVVNGILDKHTDSIVSNFQIKVKNPNAQKLLDSFIHDTNFYTICKAWVKEGLGKGNGFIEIDLKEIKLRVMNANYMYVKRNKKGQVLEYNQYTKQFNKVNYDNFDKTTDIINFKPNQIAHLQINKTPNDAYGMGILISNETVIENSIKNDADLQILVERKAAQPYHVKVGEPGKVTPRGVVDQVRNTLTYLNNSHNWVTDADVDIKTITFPDLGKNLTDTNMYYFRKLLAGTQMPEVLMGSGQLNEGIAKTQLKAHGRFIKSIQNQVSDIIEEKIIRPILRSKGLDEQPTFIWDLPDDEEINLKITGLNALLMNPFIQPGLKARIQEEIADLLGYEDMKDKLESPEEADKRVEDEKAQQIELQTKPETKPETKTKQTFDFNQAGENLTIDDITELLDLLPKPEVPNDFELNDNQVQRMIDLVNLSRQGNKIDLTEGWFTAPNGAKIYIDDTGKGYGGQNAVAVSAADKVKIDAYGKDFHESKIAVAKEKGYADEIQKNEMALNKYSNSPTEEARNEIQSFATSDSPAAVFDRQVTQKRLESKYGKTVTLYRGINEGETANDRGGRVISWTQDSDVAGMFAGEKGTKVIMKRMPIKDIVASSSTHGTLNVYGGGEYEFLAIE